MKAFLPFICISFICFANSVDLASKTQFSVQSKLSKIRAMLGLTIPETPQKIENKMKSPTKNDSVGTKKSNTKSLSLPTLKPNKAQVQTKPTIKNTKENENQRETNKIIKSSEEESSNTPKFILNSEQPESSHSQVEKENSQIPNEKTEFSLQDFETKKKEMNVVNSIADSDLDSSEPQTENKIPNEIAGDQSHSSGSKPMRQKIAAKLNNKEVLITEKEAKFNDGEIDCNESEQDKIYDEKMVKDGWTKAWSNCTHSKWERNVFFESQKPEQVSSLLKNKGVSAFSTQSTNVTVNATDTDDDSILVSDGNSKPMLVPTTYMAATPEYQHPGIPPKNLEILKLLMNGGYLYTRGFQGVKGKTGPKGCIGDQGDKGPKGDNGTDAVSNGTVKGPTGEPGYDGPRGGRGDQGDTGDIGDVGAIGPQGITGRNGRNGTNGFPGPKGPTGLKGVKGPKGKKGPIGDVGSTGFPGLRGDPGIKGQQGPQGIPGIAGNKGIKGKDADPPDQMKMKFMMDNSIVKTIENSNNSIQNTLIMINSTSNKSSNTSTQFRLAESPKKKLFLPILNANASQLLLLKEFDARVGDLFDDYDFSKLNVTDTDSNLHESLSQLIQNNQIQESKEAEEGNMKKKIKFHLSDVLGKCSFEDSNCSRVCMWALHSMLEFVKESKYSMVAKNQFEADFKEKLKKKTLDCSLVWVEN